MVVVALPGQALADRLSAEVPGAVQTWDESAVWVDPSTIAGVAKFLREDPEMDFQFLNSITAVDFIGHLEIVYHLTSLNE